MQISPMMRQYMEIKDQHKDRVLFFRLGDFYEMFFDDALLVSKELELTLTGKNYGQAERAPMCGVPFHSADGYIAKLVEKGYQVAICEQTEDPALAKGLVKREVVRIVTPGTLLNQSMLNERENNYLASVFDAGHEIGFAYCDVSTGELYATGIDAARAEETLANELSKINAREVITNEGAREIEIGALYTHALGKQYHNPKTAEETVLRQLSGTLTSLGLDGKEAALLALGALLLYLFDTQKQSLSHISRLNYYEIRNHMALDKATIKNLELTETLFEKRLQGSLLGVLDRTHTAMGARKMKQWIREPLNQTGPINERLSAVETLSDEPLLRNDLKENLKRIYDLERLSGRIACGSANAKDLLALKQSVFALPRVKEDLRGCGDALLEELGARIGAFDEIRDLIEKAILDDAPFTVKEGGLIKKAYSAELDEIKDSIKDGQAWIAGLERAERERTGIKNLKVGFNRVFGYYIEITKS